MIARSRLVWGLLALVILLALVVAGIQRAPRPAISLVTDTVEDESVLIRIDHFEATYNGETSGVEPAPSPSIAWLMEHSPLFARLWSRTHRTYEMAPPGTIYVVVQATIVPKNVMLSDDFEYRLDYGAYTIGTGYKQVQRADGQPLKVGTRFMVTDGPMPKALEIQVNGRWLRFPVRSGR